MLRRLMLINFGILSFVSAATVAVPVTHYSVVVGISYAFAATALAYWMLKQPPRLSFLGWNWRVVIPIVLILLVLAVGTEWYYLTVHNLPSFATSAPALEEPARLLVHGHDPYREVLRGGLPISPGPGWVILHSPFTLSHLTPVAGTVVLGLAVALLRREDPYASSVFFVLMVLQPIFQSQINQGQDLYLISIALVCLALAADRLGESTRNAILLGAAAGMVATARIPIVLMTGILALGLVRKNRRIGCHFAAAMLITCGVLHAIFALWSDRAGHFYQPMHVLGRAAESAGLGWRIAVAALLFGSVLWIVLRMKGSASYWMLGMYFAMISLFTPEALKEFVHTSQFNWEASTYITFPLPLLLASLVLTNAQARAEEAGLERSLAVAGRRPVRYPRAVHA